MKLALPAARVDKAAAEDAGDLCQFLLPRCIIYKWRLAPAGSLAARSKSTRRARRWSSPGKEGRLLRTLLWVCLLVTVSVGVATAQTPAPQNSNPQNKEGELVLQGDTTPRPALPTYFGDTGLWFVPTAETFPRGRPRSVSTEPTSIDHRD